MEDTQKAPEETIVLTAYCPKTKQRNVPMLNATIIKFQNTYMAKGDDGQGNKMSVILKKEKALKAIEQGVAKKDFED